MRIVRRVLSPIGVLLAFVAGGWCLRWLTDGSLSVVQGGNPSFDALLVLVVAVLAWACFGWLAARHAPDGALGAARSASALPAASLAEQLTPEVYRRAARVALGLSVAAGPVLGRNSGERRHDRPAHPGRRRRAVAARSGPARHGRQPAPGRTPAAQPRPTRWLLGGRPVVGRGTFGLPTPDRPTSDRSTSPWSSSDRTGLPNPERPQTHDPVTRPPLRHVDASDQITVKRGDNLWNIAKDHLPTGASNAEINRSGTAGTTPTDRSSATTPT